MQFIRIRGARVNNLKNIDLDLPIGKLICFAGPSGSGKTSIAFHTLLAESKRRFLNSYPSSMKFFSERPTAVDVDEIYPVLPVFGLPQINPVVGARTTVQDVMRLTDELQNLFFNFSEEYCPIHLEKLQMSKVADKVKKNCKQQVGIISIFVSKQDYWRIYGEQNFPVRSFNKDTNESRTFELEDDLFELFRVKAEKLSEIDNKLSELPALRGLKTLYIWGNQEKNISELKISSKKQCPTCSLVAPEMKILSMFSPYSALGACKKCNGYGANLIYEPTKMFDHNLSVDDGGIKILSNKNYADNIKELKKILKKKAIPSDRPIGKLGAEFWKLIYEGEGNFWGVNELLQYLETKKYKPATRIFLRNIQREEICDVCNGSRLNNIIDCYFVGDKNKFNLKSLVGVTIIELKEKIEEIKSTNNHHQNLLKLIKNKIDIAIGMGLGHLVLSRKAKSISAGEYQRLLLLKYLAFQGTDGLFVLDEPSLGLSSKEQHHLIRSLRNIVDQGNTVILIDHSREIINQADYVVEMGPQSGKFGGEVKFAGEQKAYKNFVEKKESVIFPRKRSRLKEQDWIHAQNVTAFGKRYSDFDIPRCSITWVNGPSGSGKTSVLVNSFAQKIFKNKFNDDLVEDAGVIGKLTGDIEFDDIVVIDSNLNRFTSRSSVGSLTDLAPVVRKHFLKLPISKQLQLKDGHFSSNSELGMCAACEGKGHKVIEMQFLEDVVLECEECGGRKIKPQYANITDGTMTVYDAYQRPLNEVLPRIELTPKFKRIWEYLKILNLDYLSLERSVNSLSGGEKQRIYLLSKLLSEMKNSLLIFENLSFGLSPIELSKLAGLLQALANQGNTLLIIDADPCFKEFCDFSLKFGDEKINLTIL